MQINKINRHSGKGNKMKKEQKNSSMIRSKLHNQLIMTDIKPIPRASMHLSLIKMGLIGTTLLNLSLSSYAGISATTVKTIQGSAPYFLLDDGSVKSKISTTDELVGFQYIDESGSVAQADKSMNGTIIKLSSSMNQSDLLALVAIDGVQHQLGDVLTTPNTTLFVGDDDGDAAGTDAAGLITATLKTNGVKTRPKDIPFNPCSGVYTLEINVAEDTSGKLQAKTVYGDPYYRDYTASTATYTLLPGSSTAYVCSAQPSLSIGTGVYAGPVSQWDSSEGFYPQSMVDPTKNFPTTGFNNAYFYLIMAGTTAKQVIESTTGESGLTATYTPEGTSGVSVELSAGTANTNMLKVPLKGPSMNSATIPKHVATLFDLKLGQDTVYRFSIDKWFIARYGVDSGYSGTTDSALTYCTNLGGGNKYRVPSVLND